MGKKKFFKFNDRKVYLIKDLYMYNDTLAVVMLLANNEEYGTITVNLNDGFQSDRLAYVDENNLPGIGKWLEQNQLATPTGMYAQSGFCTYPLYMFFTDNL